MCDYRIGVFNNDISKINILIVLNISLYDSLLRSKKMDYIGIYVSLKGQIHNIMVNVRLLWFLLVPAYRQSIISAWQGGPPAQPLKSVKLVDLRL